MFFKKYNFYEAIGQNRLFRQTVSSSKDIKERKSIEEYSGNGNWKSIEWKDWSGLPLSYLTDAGAKKAIKQIA